MIFETLHTRWDWLPIPHCPGRYRLRAALSTLSISELVGEPIRTEEYSVPAARDKVIVAVLPDGSGILSYAKADGTWLHTLNTQEGLARKLASLGIR